MKTKELLKYFPEEVPFLLEEDMTKDQFYSEDGKRACLIGWASHLINEICNNILNDPDKKWNESSLYIEQSFMRDNVRNFLLQKIQSAIEINYPEYKSRWHSIQNFNDSHTNRQNAEVFNYAMKKLGYTNVVDAPEIETHLK